MVEILAAAAVTEISWPSVIGGVLTLGIVQLLTTVLTVRVAVAKIEAQSNARFEIMFKTSDELKAAAGKSAEDVARIERDRLRCVAEAGQTYASHGEVLHVLAAQSARDQHLADQMEGLHGRITDVATALSELKGEIRRDHNAH